MCFVAYRGSVVKTVRVERNRVNITIHSYDNNGLKNRGLCPGVPVHRGNNYCTPLFTSLCLAVAYCWVYCIGTRGPCRTESSLLINLDNMIVPETDSDRLARFSRQL